METNKDQKKSGIESGDRRVRRTKKQLKNALTELIQEKGYDDVKVQEIIDRADVGRTSFYTYFKSKEDLLLQNLDDLEHMFEPGRENKPDEFSLKMFQHLKENWRLAKLLLGNKKLPIVRNYVQNILIKYYKNLYQEKYNSTKTDFEIEGAAAFISGALLSLILWWFAMKKPVSPEELHEVFMKIKNPDFL